MSILVTRKSCLFLMVSFFVSILIATSHTHVINKQQESNIKNVNLYKQQHQKQKQTNKNKHRRPIERTHCVLFVPDLFILIYARDCFF